ncbi:MAG: bifunctional phosphopantothenoylcysteine decarboxylase/phosphopantothenate--cysteine ligase CoaBC [Ferruginibacter sp.]
MFKGKKIILGVTGSIAAYKAALIVRLLIKAGAEVKVIMTPSACNFIAPLTLSTLSKNEVLSQLSDNISWANHVMLGRWADIMLIAPLSCNTLSKMANGGCDNLLLAVYLSATCPVVVAPAMDEDMWHHETTKSNVLKLASVNNKVIPVNNGELASGLSGDGRMAEPEEIIGWLDNFFKQSKQLAGKKVLITAGPTYEAIDPVRFIGNNSSGKMGIAIAEEFKNRGAQVSLVIGPGIENLPQGIQIIKVRSAAEMYEACTSLFSETDIAVMNAAVADYTPTEPGTEKIKKDSDLLTIELKKTNDILKKLGEMKSGKQFIVGFALETNNEKENALKKLQSKNADMIVLNSLNDAGAGFGHNTNKITIFDRKGGEYYFNTKSKREVAADIINTIISITHA